jgi:hypothetical protein
MRLDRGHHWHGPHQKGLNNPSDLNLVRWRKAINGAAEDLDNLGIEVLNASPVSTVTAFPIVLLKDVFDG